MVTLAPQTMAQMRKSYTVIAVSPDASKQGPGMRYTNVTLGARASSMTDSEHKECIRGETGITAISSKRVQWKYDGHINIQEVRALLISLNSIYRQHENIGKRIIVFTVSQIP